MMHRGFTTATCIKCKGGQVPEFVISPLLNIPLEGTQEPQDGMLYNDSSLEKIGLARSVFRALGFGRKKMPVPSSKRSKEVAQSKKRKPLFGPEDEETIANE